jgi:hypothetical protein
VSFRQPKREHRDETSHHRWLLEHGDHLAALGLPLRVFETWERWTDFLANGGLDRFEDSTHFSFELLHPAQLRRLHAFLEDHFSDDPPNLLRWLRVRAAEGRI